MSDAAAICNALHRAAVECGRPGGLVGSIRAEGGKSGSVKPLHLFAALSLGIAVVALGLLFQQHIPASVLEIMFFPGLALGSLLFGHSVSMWYTATATNTLFYSLVSLTIIRVSKRLSSR